MEDIYFPILNCEAALSSNNSKNKNRPFDLRQISSDSLIAYLGTRGFGIPQGDDEINVYDVNALPVLMYYDIFKNYYANKQEENAYIISTTPNVDVEIIRVR